MATFVRAAVGVAEAVTARGCSLDLRPVLVQRACMALADIDAWVGRTLFIPPIIKLCQITRQTQFAISRLLWFVVALDQLRLAHSLFQQIIAAIFALVMMFTASVRADFPTMSMLWLRVMGWVLLTLDLLAGVVRGDWLGVEIWALVLFAEYAATIRTIPPADSGKRQREARGSEILRP